MIVNKLGTGLYAQVSLQGKVLTIGTDVIDLDARQTDSQEIITIRDGEAYVAVVEIPPRSYHPESLGDTAPMEDMTATQMVFDDLDTEAVRVTLWPITTIDKEL